MDNADVPKDPNSGIYAVSRSRGKQPGESRLTARIRERRKADGKARSSDESEAEDELASGAVVLHKLFNRSVVLYPNNTVIKSGHRIVLGEAEALKTAARAGVLVPTVHKAYTAPDGRVNLCMDYVPGESLDKLWPVISDNEKINIAHQLRAILERMRSVDPPRDLISACDGTEIRDSRVYFTYHAPACRGEHAFNEYLLSSLEAPTPPLVREALSRGLRTDHRIVLSHCDLAPRNIIVQDGKITGLVDWEDSGWYPEYWEYVKFFQRPSTHEWKRYAEHIFPEFYHDELIQYFAMARWQSS